MSTRVTFRLVLLLALCLCAAAIPACKKSAADRARLAMEKGDFTTAIQFYMEAGKANPQDTALRAALSEARLRYAKQFAIDAVRGQHDNAVDWERLLEHLEQEGNGVKMELLDAYYSLAEIYKKGGETDKALEVLLKALTRDPSRRIPLGKIVDLIKARKDAAWGTRTFETLVQKYPDDQEICAKFGYFLGNNARWDEAINRYHSCLALNPGDFTYNNDIRMEISTLEKRRKNRADKNTDQPGAMHGD